MTNRIVVISDIHLHPWSAFSKGDGLLNSRLQHTLRVLNQSLEFAASHKVPWVCAGDLVHTIGFTTNVVLNAWIRLLETYPEVDKYAVSGNHDTRGKGPHKIKPSESILPPLVAAVDRFYLLVQDNPPVELWKDGPTIYGEGAQPKSDLLDLGPGADIGLFHLIIKGTSAPNGFLFDTGTDRAELLSRYHLSICGDIHHPQIIREDGKFILIPGSPEHHNFGDKGEHGWWDVHLEKREDGWYPTHLNPIYSRSPKFLTVVDVEDVKPDGNFYRIQGVTPLHLIPDNATVMASPPTIVSTRDLISAADGLEPILNAWLETEEPPVSVKEAKVVAVHLCRSADLDLIPQPAILVTIEANDFMCYKHFRHAIMPGTTLVVGRSRDFTSNGAGKSTIFEALYWCLFGKTTKGVAAEDVIRRGADSCDVSLVIHLDDDDQTPVRITRGRGPVGVAVVASIGDVSISGASANEVATKVCKLLGFTPDIFRALGYYSQEKVFLFSRVTDSERKEVLADLMGLNAYQVASTEASAKAAEFDEEASKKEIQLTTIQRYLVTAEEDVARLKQRLSESRQIAEAYLVRMQEDLTKLQNGEIPDVANYQEEESEIQRVIQQTVTTLITAKEDEADAERTQVSRKLEVAKTLLEEEDAKLRAVAPLMAERSQKYGGCETDLLRSKATLDAARALQPGEECPTCKQVVGANHITMMLEKAEAEFERARVARTVTGAAAEDIREEMRKQNGAVAEIRDRVTHLTQEQHHVEYLHREVKRLEELLGDRKKQRDQWWKKTIKSIEVAIIQAEQEENPFQEEFDKAVERVEVSRREVSDLETETEQLRIDQSIYQYWSKGFGKQGIQSLLLAGLAEDFNQSRTDVFPLLTRGVYDVQFSTLSTTRAGELREKTDFFIYEHGQQVSYNSLSGGQRRRIDVGTMLCLALAQSRMRNIQGVLGLLILDEIFDYLDVDGAEAVCEVLEEVNQTIPSIYVVSQRTEMQSLFPQSFEVVQDNNGISRIAS